MYAASVIAGVTEHGRHELRRRPGLARDRRRGSTQPVRCHPSSTSRSSSNAPRFTSLADLVDRAAAFCERVRTSIASTYGLTVTGIALTRRGSVPKTSGGKVRRGACRDVFLAGDLPVLASWQCHA